MRLTTGMVLIVALAVLAVAGCGQPPAPTATAPGPRRLVIEVLRFNEYSDYYAAHITALTRALTDAGYRENRDFVINARSAQNELSNVPQIIDAAVAAQPDLIITLQGPLLFTALKKAPAINKLFAIITDPLVLGAGSSDTSHLPHVTGIYEADPIAALFDAVRQCTPRPTRIGTIFMVGDAESVFVKEQMAKLASERGLTLVAQPYTAPGEITEALRALTSQQVDALIPISDAYQDIVYTLMAKLSADQRLPLFAFWHYPGSTAALVCANGTEADEVATFAELAVRILKGEDPAQIPFVNMGQGPATLTVYEPNARAVGLTVPAAVRQHATIITQ
ncbi:MAG TPA: ABC transporter substrate binding protein [bacterium]|nr:ABC transporter substrate binding protein [bacterium]